ncbi:hypothetical protein GCM10010193_06790 [Kitasatospora atroaurantiaca]|nr:hypothetical protein [Kitasatospora atroaurantiaca]
MTNPKDPHAPDLLHSDGASAAASGRAPAASRPRWVSVFAITAIALVVVFVIVHLAGGGMAGHH